MTDLMDLDPAEPGESELDEPTEPAPDIEPGPAPDDAAEEGHVEDD